MAIEPSPEELQRFRDGDDGQPLVLVQLLRFVEGGRDKYLDYADAAQGILARLGAQILYAGEAGPPLLAAEGQPWDGIVVIRYPSRAAYLEMLADPQYRAITHLRREALREAAMLPMEDWPGR